MNPSTIQLQQRDVAVLQGLLESRLMTVDQASRIYFQGHSEAAKKRLQQLRGAGFIGERPRRPAEPLVLFLTRMGYEEVRRHGVPEHYPPLSWDSLEKRVRVSELTLKHELAVMDAKAAISAAVAKRPDLELTEFSTWPVLYQFRAKRPDPFGGSLELPVRPDGFLRILEQVPGKSEAWVHMFFLEIDRSTETQGRLSSQAACYRDYYQSGHFAQRFGRRREEFKSIPFRVLMVFRNPERRNNTAVQLLRASTPFGTLTWLTTMSELERDPLSAIWVRPLDYRAATVNTPFAIEREPNGSTYRRRPEREEFIERAVVKHALLEG